MSLMQPIDQFSDVAFGTLYRQISRMPGLEAFVKQASVEPEVAKGLPDSAFAWPSERKFPIHTPEHAALSYAYSKVASIPDEVKDNISTALTVYNIPESIFTEKVASEETQYLVPQFRLFPVTSPGQFKKAQEDLLNSMSKLDLENRALACANLIKKADELQVQAELHPEILKVAGLVVSDTKVAREWIEARIGRLADTDTVYKTAYETLAQGLSKQPSEVSDRNGLLKVASVLADLDEHSGLDKHYDRKLPDALRTIFNTEKIAADSIELDGTYIPAKKILALPASFWEDLGGKELSDEVAPGGVVDPQKLRTVVETLPLDLKLQLKAHCR